MNSKTGKTRISKKALCVILSLIMAFGTFITFTVGYSPLHEWLGIRNMLSAYAAEFVDTDGAVAVDEEAMLADDHTINLENKDGSNTVYLFSEPISYTDKYGNLRTKDLSVEKANSSLKDKGYDYTNGQNNYRINFSKDHNKGIQVRYNNSSFKIAPQSIIDVEGQESVAEYLSENFEVFQYKNIYGNGTNLRYYPQLNGLKDEIVLNQNINKNTFSFDLTTDNCNARLTDEGTITLVDSNSNVLYTFEVPYAYDSEYVEGERNEHINNGYYTLSDNGNGNYVLTININKKWLESKNTVYPVIIDPTTSHLEQNKDVSAYSSHPNTNYGTDKTLSFGKTTANGKGRVYTHFHIPEEIANYATINSAAQWERELTGETSSMGVSAYLVEADWDSTTLTWNNKPSYNSNIKSPQKNINSASTDKPNYPLWYKFDIKNILQSIVGKDDMNVKNYGMVFVAACETNSNERWRTFAARNYQSSAYRPYTVINYTNDTTPPSISSITRQPTEWANGTVTFTINATDASSGLANKAYGYSVDNNSFVWSSSKNITLNTFNRTMYLAVKDKAGNQVTTTRGTYIDRLNPYVPTLSDNNTYNGEWTNQNVTISINIRDRYDSNNNDGCSGMGKYSCTTDENPSANVNDWINTDNGAGDYTLPVFTEYGKYYVYAKDRANNISTEQYTKKDLVEGTVNNLEYGALELQINIDKNIPQVNNVNISTNSDTGISVVHIVASDDLSGIKEYSLDGGNSWVEVDSDTNGDKYVDITSTVNLNGGQANVRVKDLAGNISSGDIVPLSKPEFYDYNGLVGLYNPNQNGVGIEYKIGNSDSWETYTSPFELTNEDSVTVYARFINSETETHKTFEAAEEGVIEYTETVDDLIIENNGISFDISRVYHSGDNKWSFSTQANATRVNNKRLINITTPDGDALHFVKVNSSEYKDEIENTTLRINNSQYVFTVDDITYSYNISNGRLASISDKFSNNITFNYNSDNRLITIVSAAGNETRTYTVSENDDEQLSNIITPLNEELVYQYSGDKLVKVYYDKNTLQFGRSDDIIIGEYEYDDNKLFKTNGNTISYDEDGNYVSVTTPAGEVIENEPETTETETEPETGATNPEPETQPEPTYTYFDGTQTVHTETTNYTNGNKTYTTVNEYNIDSQLIKITETETETNGAGGTTVVCTKITEYEYFSNSDDIQTETITETIGTETTETETTYNQSGKTLSESVTQNGQTTLTQFTYDDFGNNINVTVSVGGNVNSETIYEYDDLNRCIKETLNVPNENAEVTLYAYNPLDDVIYEKVGTEVTRTLYDKYCRVIQEIEPQDYAIANATDGILDDNNGYLTGSDSYSNSNIGHRYVYDTNTRLLTHETNRLDVVTDYTYHPNSSVIATESFDVYVLSYNPEGKITGSTVNGNTYASYTYDETTGNPSDVVYGNGQSVHYEYDNNGNLWKQYHNNDSNPYVTYTYVRSKDGTLINTEEQLDIDEALFIETNEDFVINTKTNTDSGLFYVYSNEGRVSVTDINNTSAVLYSYYVTQNDNNNISTVSGVVGNKDYSVASSENGITNTYDGNSLSAESTVNNTVTTTAVKINGTTAYMVTETENATADIKSYGNTISFTDTYANADKEQISSSSDGTDTVSYQYYADGQLHTVSGNNYTASYSYNSRGNLTEKTVNNVTTNYSYTNDRLMSVNNTPLAYDSIGNVLSYGDKHYTWSSGRNLASITDGTNNYTYTYNKYGYRTSKTVNGVTTDFNVAEDGTVVSQTDGTNTLFFEYAEDGTPIGFVLNDTQYLYITNNSADVMAIADSTGNVVATYSYNEWGEVTVNATGDNLAIANLNPLRYRGYFYDSETGYYYLQSRYYDPTICRFINADLPEYASEQKDETAGINIFVYCCNDAVNNSDSTGLKRIKNTIIAKWKAVLKAIKNTVKEIKNHLISYFKEQFVFNAESFSISNTVIATTIDIIIATFVSFKVVAAGKTALKKVTKKLIEKSPKKFNKFIKKVFKYLKDKGLYNVVAELYLYVVTHFAIKKITNGKYSFSRILKDAAKDLALDIAAKVLNIPDNLYTKRISTIITAFSSIGGVFSFFFDHFDGSWDGYLTIKYKYMKTYVV